MSSTEYILLIEHFFARFRVNLLPKLTLIYRQGRNQLWGRGPWAGPSSFCPAPQLSLGPRTLARPPSLSAGQQLSCTRQTLTSGLSFIALKVKRSNSRTRTNWQLPSVNFTYLQLRNRGAQNRYITVTDPKCYLTAVTRYFLSATFYPLLCYRPYRV